MKTPIEILAEVVGCSPDFVQRYADKNTVKVPIPDAIEAMKIAMKQAYIAGQNSIKMTDHAHVIDADEYLNKLEDSRHE